MAVLEGAPAAAALNEKTADCTARLREKGIVPTLAVIGMQGDAAGGSYRKRLEKQLGALGHRLVAYDVQTEEELAAALQSAAEDCEIHGILPLLPFPRSFDTDRLLSLIPLKKDVDGVGFASYAAAYAGKGEGFLPCTAKACVELADFYNIELVGKRCAVVGRSLVVGRPLALQLIARDATVTVCHTKTRNLAEVLRQQDVIFLAAGAVGLVGADCVREGQFVIDAGVSQKDGRLTGDAAFKEIEPIVAGISPVPGGVGALTAAVLCANLTEAAR